MDCSKAVDFLIEKQRLCDSRPDCKTSDDVCLMYAWCDIGKPDPEKNKGLLLDAIEKLQKWSDEHPKKTYAQDFFEKFPKAQGCSDGSPFVCRRRIYGGECPTDDCYYTGACKNCWNEPMNEESGR